MPLRWVEPELFLEHNGVKVYKTYRHDIEEDSSEFIFTTDESDSDRDSDSEFHFDVRDKSAELSRVYIGSGGHFPSSPTHIIGECIDHGLIPVPPDAVLGMLADQLEDSELLLELVHEVASRSASNVNNSGPLEQLRFLVDNVGFEDAKQLVEEILDRSRGVK